MANEDKASKGRRNSLNKSFFFFFFLILQFCVSKLEYVVVPGLVPSVALAHSLKMPMTWIL